MTNKEFIKDPLFKKAVELAQDDGHNVQATRRQASKFRLGTGIAYSYRRQANLTIEKEKEEVTCG